MINSKLVNWALCAESAKYTPRKIPAIWYVCVTHVAATSHFKYLYSYIFQDAKRALLLSGTPALSRPIELFTQIKMLDRNFRTINAIQFGLRYCDGVKVNCCYITVMVFSYIKGLSTREAGRGHATPHMPVETA